MTNPLLDFTALPHFDTIEPNHVSPAIDLLLGEAEQSVRAAEIADPVTWDSFVVPLDETEALGRAWNQVAHLQAVANTPELRRAYNTNLPKMTRFGTAVGQNKILLDQYSELARTPSFATFNAARKKVVENALRDFALGGAKLSGKKKARYSAIQEELAGLSARFEQNVLDATDGFALYVEDEKELTGLPTDVVAQCRMAAKNEDRAGYKLGLAMPCYVAVQCFADNRDLRHLLYRANVTRASEFGPAEIDNSSALMRMLELRAELAELLDFDSYAHYSLATKMASTPDEVLVFLRDLARRARPFALRDREELEAFARQNLGIETLEAWDLAYASDKLKQSRYSFSAQEVKQYFTKPKVLAGLFDLIQSLYGLKVELDNAPVWHSDVRFYRLVDGEGGLVGQFYLDLYAREGKRGGAWMDVCRNRRDTASGPQTPLVYLVCNFGKGVDGRDATFSHGEVTTLFHEMGHGLHQLLTEVGELGVAGINGVEWDAVELPSQFMENFCWEWERVQAMTAHTDTGQPLPRALFDKMREAKNFQSGMATLRQVEMAMFDMDLHSRFDPAIQTLQQLLDQVRAEVSVNIPPAWNRFPNAFTHIFSGGYGAGYYSYKWAEVLSADAYAAFEEASEPQEKIGARFRSEILARGGSRSALENFRAFRGRVPRIDALLRHGGMSA